MKIRLSEEHRFWGGMAIGALVVLLMLVLWVIPARKGAARADDDWARQTQLVRLLQSESARDNLPSSPTLADRARYRTWLDEQADLVEEYFGERSALLDAPITGESDVAPADFKDAYVRVVARQREWLASNKDGMLVPDTRGAFRVYAWETGSGLPDPNEFQTVLRHYWARYYLYRLFDDADVAALHKVETGRLRQLSPEFDGMQFRADLSLPPEKVRTLVEKLLTVSPSVTSRPVFDLQEVTVSAKPQVADARPLCGVVIAGHVLLRRPAPTATPADREAPGT